MTTETPEETPTHDVPASGTSPVTELTDLEFAEQLQGTLRRFRVIVQGGVGIDIDAHFHDAGQVGVGHLSFMRIDTNGVQRVIQVFHHDVWRSVSETTTPERREEIARIGRAAQERQDLSRKMNQPPAPVVPTPKKGRTKKPKPYKFH